jgi:hypothetical protein
MRLEVFMVVMIQVEVEVFWVVMPFSVAAGYQCFRGPSCLHLHPEGWYPTTTLHSITTQKTEDRGSIDI